MKTKKIEIRPTGRYGHGVFARTQIRKGEVVGLFDGPIYDGDFPAWTKDLLNHAIQIGPSEWRDSTGHARLMNHSCEPNCGFRGRFKVVAMRSIHPGEELTWDYEMTERSWWWRLRCRCGAKTCRQRIGDYRRMPASLRLRYKGYISTWLEPLA